MWGHACYLLECSLSEEALLATPVGSRGAELGTLFIQSEEFAETLLRVLGVCVRHV